KNFPTPESQGQVQRLYISNNQGVNSKTNSICHFYNTQLEGKLDLAKFINLSYLEIRGSSFNIDTYQKLTQFNLTDCKKLKSFYLYYNDGQLSMEGGSLLNELYLQYCQNLVDLGLAEQLTSLSCLNIKHCSQLARIHNLDKLTNLNTLCLYGCLNLSELNGLNKLTNLILDGFSQLNSLVIDDCPLQDIYTRRPVTDEADLTKSTIEPKKKAERTINYFAALIGLIVQQTTSLKPTYCLRFFGLELFIIKNFSNPKPTFSIFYPQKELKQAYQLVSQDLFNRLVKAQPSEAIQIGTRGSFGSLKKTESQQKCG
ncbi:17407_t:CDS:2, partial [Funneliformis geosporum]